MATQSVYFKEHEGIVHNSMGQVPSSWWGSFTSKLGYGESCGQLKSFSMDLPSGGDQLIANKQAGRGTEHGAERGHTTQFNIFPDNCKSSGDGQKPQATISLQSSPSEYRGRFELGFSQPMIYAKYPYVDQCYGVFPNCGPQISGRVMLLPMNMATDDGPIYVNAKQYHGIIRRRQSRAKAVMENKLTRARKPYMHESRHLHAMRRPRGCGGRFLNTKNTNKEKSGTEVIKTGDGQLSQGTGSQGSEVLQSDSDTFNSSKDAKGSGSNISEVTSMFSRGDLDRFQINHLIPPAHPFADLIDGRRGLVMPKWVTAPDNCCNLTV
ncbi:nuclear transcription factor Y subunit A-10-like isoform X2 [Quercus lobata]|uniref:Nuclear transcription factor Y subunit n=1 Tax=Quercus lobata TaxID=97700 RepID=A0A7N2M3F5_QUELO|nr:nuclear transcription factor Y subunit A-10-like isoform X2 [Quercus lobata]